MKRVFWIVADSLGVGALPDAADFGDAGANTFASLRKSPKLSIPCLTRLGLSRIADGTGIYTAVCGKAAEASRGKDTVTGHWEMCGIVSARPFPVYPHGFPPAVLEPFSRATGRGVLCNLPYSGTEVIRDYGADHLRTGDLIVYTSADSVFQIAAHTDIVPEQTLYTYCKAARAILQGEHAVGRVIARPFCGEWPFTRTSGRHDFGVTAHYPTRNNDDGMQTVQRLFAEDFRGLCFVNLVDFDMLYGHRRDTDGYAAALSALDAFLAELLPRFGADDALLLTGDHGCDPGFSGTDHTREYVPVLLWSPSLSPREIGVRGTFADMGASVAALLGVPWDGAGISFTE